MAVTFERVAPVLPVRDLAAALAHYRKLGFQARAYGETSPSGPIYGFVSWRAVELHLALARDLDPQKNTSACYLWDDDLVRTTLRRIRQDEEDLFKRANELDANK